MIQITKNEAQMIRKHLPGVAVKKTVHKYYTEECFSVLSLLKRMHTPQKAVTSC